MHMRACVRACAGGGGGAAYVVTLALGAGAGLIGWRGEVSDARHGRQGSEHCMFNECKGDTSEITPGKLRCKKRPKLIITARENGIWGALDETSISGSETSIIEISGRDGIEGMVIPASHELKGSGSGSGPPAVLVDPSGSGSGGFFFMTCPLSLIAMASAMNASSTDCGASAALHSQNNMP